MLNYAYIFRISWNFFKEKWFVVISLNKLFSHLNINFLAAPKQQFSASSNMVRLKISPFLTSRQVLNHV